MIERYRCPCGVSLAVGATQTVCRACGGAMDIARVCPHGDPACPCPDGLACHYEAAGDTPAMPRHGRDCPARCSICLGATPKRVTLDGAVVLVDGEPERAVDGDNEQARYYSRRGGNAGRRVKS